MISETFKHLLDKGNVKYDRFIRTTDPDHKQSVTALWNRLMDMGFIYKGAHEGWYSVSDEAFYTESQIHDWVDDEGCKIMVCLSSRLYLL